MKILMTTDAVGGVWTYTLELAREFAGHGIQVALATMGPEPSQDQRSQVRAIRGTLLCESEYKLEWMEDPWRDVDAAGEWLLELEEILRPDIIHLNGYAHGSLRWSAPVVMVAHSCVLSWWQAVKHESAPIQTWGVYRDRVQAGVNAANYVVAPTQAMLDCVRTFYGRKAAMSVVPNGKNFRDFECAGNAAQKEDFIASSGRLWDEAKNIAAIERIAPQLSWPVYLAGSTAAPDGHKATHRHCRLVDVLRPKEFAIFLSKASIFCLPARYEPFGLCPLEAALSGCALVLGDIPSLREIWDDAAVFVSPEDDQQILNAVRTLISDSARRNALAEKARERALRYSAAGMAEAYKCLYLDLLADQHSTAPKERKLTACAS